MIGAAGLASQERFDLAITLDVGLTGDIPGPEATDFPCRLGGGPIVVVQDASCHYSRRLTQRLLATAGKYQIPIQRAIFQHYGSDGAAFLRHGIETALLAYPTRYTHSPIETVDLDDITATIRLIESFVTE